MRITACQPRLRYGTLSEKQTKRKDWGRAEVVEPLPSKSKALSLIPTAEKKRKNLSIYLSIYLYSVCMCVYMCVYVWCVCGICGVCVVCVCG
jgi:hypothetical protein